MNGPDGLPLSLYALGDYSVVIVLGVAALVAVYFTAKGLARGLGLAAMALVLALAIGWTHARHVRVAGQIADTKRQVDAVKAKVADRDAQIAAHEKKITDLEAKINASEAAEKKDEAEAAHDGADISARTRRAKALEGAIEARERGMETEP